MNYRLKYDWLINRARNRNVVGYTEKHHILPKSLRGTNKKENIIRLTAREHFIAHWLLSKIYNNPQMTYAFWRMCNKSDNRNYTINSKTYSKTKEEFSILMKNRVGTFTGRTHTDKTKLKMRNSQLGHIVTEETREKLSISHTGISTGPIHTDEHKDALRKRMLGNTFGSLSKGISRPPLSEAHKQAISQSQLGKINSEETKDKMNKSKTGKSFKLSICPHCNKSGGINNMKRWHFENCKNVINTV
jgi:hypothetical protein